MDGGAWWAAVHGVAESRTRLSDFTFTFHFHALEKEMATHSSILAWQISWTKEPRRLQLMGLQRVNTIEHVCTKFLLLLSRFSRVRLCATLETAALQAPLSLGFSRQEYWSGWPFPSPMDESEK